MYKVFANEHPIILTNILTKEDNHRTYLLETAPLLEIIKNMGKPGFKEVHLYNEDPERLLSLLMKKIPTVTAAGGVVKNSQKETLFIYRKGKWDLPKGKVDKGESLEEAAIREVEEETGVKGLQINKYLRTTLHVFKRRNQYQLKETYWYSMKTSYSGRLEPQLEEEITEAAWKDKKDIRHMMHNSYENIKLFFTD